MLQAGGWLTVVPGEYVRFERVYEWFEEIRRRYSLRTIGYDPAKAFELVQKLQGAGFALNVVRQGEITLTAPQDHLKEKFLDGLVVHNNSPMFNWYLGNAKTTKRSVNQTYLITKQNKYRKIDGVAALLNAHTEYLRNLPAEIPPDRKLTTRINLKGV